MTDIDIDVATILQDDGDFSPFPNKVFALMYFLRNSPKPIVSVKYYLSIP